ncbi:MAG: DMT family transporter [Pseudomonadota bacterium]
MTRDSRFLAFGALTLAMLISSGNFIAGNLAVDDVSPAVLTFWRCLIAALCVLPFVVRARGHPLRYLMQTWRYLIPLSIVGVVLAPLLIYLALRSEDLIDLAAGYTSIPVITIFLSAFVMGERLTAAQYLGILAALLGALVFAFDGNWAKLVAFDPHVPFLFMLAAAFARALYLVLLRKWKIHPKPQEGLFAALVIGMLVLLPFFLAEEIPELDFLTYTPALWGSILFVGIGMGALYLHLITYGTHVISASAASLFTYLVPFFVTVESVVYRDAQLQLYQGIGAALIIGGVFVATRMGKPGSGG